MPAAPRPEPRHDWFLADWLRTLHMRQAQLMQLTDWDKRKASELVGGKQRYNRDVVNEAAAALNIEPFELLMHPSDAMAMRRLRDGLIRLAADNRLDYHTEDMPSRRLADGN